MFGYVQQIILVRARCRQSVLERRIDIDVTGRAGTTASAQREKFVKTGVPNDLHDRHARPGLDLPDAPLPVLDRDDGHQRPCHIGLRFVAKAAGPSIASSDANIALIAGYSHMSEIPSATEL